MVRRVPARVLALLVSCLAASSAEGFSITAQDPTLFTYETYTTEPVTVTFSEAIDAATLTPESFYVTRAGDAAKVAGTLSLIAQGRAVRLAPSSPLAFGVRYEVHVASALRSLTGTAFDGVFPWGARFVANIPNDLARFTPDPMDPIPAFVNSNVLLGFDPIDPESTDESQPWRIPGMGATEAWKWTTGRPDVVVAVVDNGMETYGYPETMNHFFLNRGELPLPRAGGALCPDYDCNGDGRFNVRDYDLDERVPPPDDGPITPADLIATFSDGVDDDGNGLPDDICGWDFFRNVNEALGVREFDEGTHGEARAADAAAIADNGVGDKPGFCPNCSILPVRTSDSIMGEYNNFGRGLEYAVAMGADVVCAASGTPNYARAVDAIIADAYERGVLVVAAIGDELGFHHSYPAAAEDVISVKSIFPIPPIDFYGVLPLDRLAFVETYCTNYGSHLHVAGSSGACSSEATGNVAGGIGLILSRARDLGIDLTANEVKQILTMTADDVAERCVTLTGGGCQEGWDEHFGYGRPNFKRALLALGAPDEGVPERIPPEVRITSPRWFTLIDPSRQGTVSIEAELYARGRPYEWTLEWATGAEPTDDEFTAFATGDGAGRVSGAIATLDVRPIFDAARLNRPMDHPNDFTVWIRCRAWWRSEDGPVLGEERKTIALHADQDEEYGLLPGFPKEIGASGESSIALADLDGAPGGRPEIVFGTSDGLVEALTYDAETGDYVDLPGWPVSLRVDPTILDVLVGTVAIGDLLGTGDPVVVAATGGGAVYAIHAGGNLRLGDDGRPAPFLDGFPVAGPKPPNDTPLSYGHGTSFGSSPVLADLDRDGALEIIATNYDGRVYAWRPGDLDGDGRADLLPGFPVLAQATKGQVGEEKWCPGEDGEEQRPAQILATPAVGILDPLDPNPDVANYPSIVVGTTEVCHEKQFSTARLYAIFHDGAANASGSPFVAGFPVVMAAPLAGALPIPPLTYGIASSPAMAYDHGVAHVGVSPFGSFPHDVRYQGGAIEDQALNSDVSINGAGHVAFGRMNGDEDLYYVMPTLSAIKKVDGWISLLRPLLMSWKLWDPGTPVLRHDLDDIHFFVNPVIADLTGDGMQEAIAGSAGFALHAVDNLERAPDSWPKFTYNWIIAAPAVGDADGDGRSELFLMTHEGNLFAWRTAAAECRGDRLSAEWRKFHHDEWNTGVYGTDTVPPRKISDLAAEHDGTTWTLTWTAPGGDRGCGAATAYDVRYSTDPDALRTTSGFAASPAVDPALVPAPGPSGSVQELRVVLPAGVYFAVRSSDGAPRPNLSLLSTIAPAPPDGGDDDEDGPGGDDDGGCGCSTAGPGDPAAWLAGLAWLAFLAARRRRSR